MKRIEKLKEKNKDLRETNRALRSGLSSTGESISHSVRKMNRLAEKLVRVKEALRGSTAAREMIEEEFDEDIGPKLIRDILATEEGVDIQLKRRLAHNILAGDIGRDIMRKLEKGMGLERAIEDSGVPLRVGKERVRILKEIGYLDNRLNLTEWGSEVLEF